jgi:hypothetical protein
MVSSAEVETILHSTEDLFVKSRAIMEAVQAVGVFSARREKVGLEIRDRKGNTIQIRDLHDVLQKLSLGNSLLKISYPALYHGLWILRRLQLMKKKPHLNNDVTESLTTILMGVEFNAKDQLRSAERSVPAWRGFTQKDGFTLNVSSE